MTTIAPPPPPGLGHEPERGPGHDAPPLPSDPATAAYLHSMEHRIEAHETRRDGWAVFAFVMGAIAVVFGLIAMGLSVTKSSPKAATGSAAAPASASVHLSEFAIEPKSISVAVGGTLQVTNGGTMTHNLAIKGTTLATAMLPPGATASLSLAGLAAG